MLNIVYEDNNIIIVNKSAGQLVQSGKGFDLDLTSEILSYRKAKGENAYAAVINRLDRPVSGLVLFAKNKREAGRLSSLMQKEGFCKEYFALICGKPDEEEGELVDYLLKDSVNNTSSVVSEGTEGSKPAKLRYKVLETYEVGENSFVSLVKIRLITGRHHQIRVQFASRHMPVLGDVKYGNNKAEITFAHRQMPVRLKRNEIALCSAELTVDGKRYSVTPEWKSDK